MISTSKYWQIVDYYALRHNVSLKDIQMNRDHRRIPNVYNLISFKRSVIFLDVLKG